MSVAFPQATVSPAQSLEGCPTPPSMPKDWLKSSKSWTSRWKTQEPSQPLSRRSSQTLVEALETDLSPPWPRDWRAYRALLGGFLLMFNSWGLVNAFGTFQSFYRTHLLMTTDTKLITLLGATQCFFTLIVSFAMGRFLDAGLHRYLAAAGAGITTLGMFMLSLTSGNGGVNEGNYVYIWLTQGLCIGLGMACVFVYSSQVVACWFPKRRSLAIGISASGASIGTFSSPKHFPSNSKC